MGVIAKLRELGDQNADDLSRSLGGVADNLLAMSPEQLAAVNAAIDNVTTSMGVLKDLLTADEDAAPLLDLLPDVAEVEAKVTAVGMLKEDVINLKHAYDQLYDRLDKLNNMGAITMDLQISAGTIGDLARNLAADDNFARAMGQAIGGIEARI